MWRVADWEKPYLKRTFVHSRAKDRKAVFDLTTCLVSYFREMLDLTTWSINIEEGEWDDRPNQAQESVTPTLHLTVLINYQYEDAYVTIHLHPQADGDYSGLRKTVLHEMLHLFLQVYVGPVTAVLIQSGLGGTDRKAASLGRVIVNAEEVLTERLTRLLND